MSSNTLPLRRRWPRTAIGGPSRSVGVLFALLLALAGCSGDAVSAEPETVDAPAMTTPVAILADPIPASTPVAGVRAPEPEPTPSTTSTTTTTVATEAEKEVVSGGSGLAIEDLTTDELEDLLADLDQILGDLDSSLAQEEGEIFNG